MLAFRPLNAPTDVFTFAMLAKHLLRGECYSPLLFSLDVVMEKWERFESEREK